ncbi:MAG: putative integral rane protein [Actinoallomurus sp.]|nr:putative integral rane protein [Actinoallomurus sp.]
MTRRDVVLLILLGAAWGAAYPLTAVVLRELSAPAVVVARTALSAIVLFPLAAHRGTLGAIRARPAGVLVAALLQVTIPLVLFTIGQRYISAGLAGILMATQPVWAAIMTAIVDRTFPPRQFAGVLTGLCGVALLFLSDVHIGGTSGLAGALLLAGAASFAAGAIWTERVIPEVPPLATATAAMTISAIALTPFAVMTTWHTPHLSTVVWLVILGVAATGGGLVLFYALVRRIGAVRANLAAYLAPGFAVAYGAVFLAERVSLKALAGLALILAGSYISVRR